MNIFPIIGAFGLVCIILGTLLISSKRNVRRKYVYPLLIVGGILLEIYSIYIRDLIFVILQGVFILTAVYGLIKMHEKSR
ncbi:hypothetical protein CMI41_02325 [Candidatus Pacearchaeota archaeon]|nr:hypothetical protein [Candidatus Pacearchaeota archaeon]|tara:strand:+ start:5673 stop:5912 length:240 start_codon:yes stop_codon:yes gene_type:complete